VLRTRVHRALAAGLLGAATIVCPAAGQDANAPGALGDMPLPGGLAGAMRAVGDHAEADRSQFLADVIRRVYRTSPGAEWSEGAPLPSLLAFLDRSMADQGSVTAHASDPDTLPLPLPAALWTAAVLGGRPMPRGLVGSIVSSREAALLYCGLLSLDDETRAWLAGQPDLVAEIAGRHAAGFVLAAPALRVTAGTVQVPGGADAAASWEALAGGARVSEPAAFVRALLARDRSVAYFFGAMAPLTAAQRRVALALDAQNPATRLTVAERLLSVFAHVAVGWDVRVRTFWRPALDPALLLADLRVDGRGRPVLPATERFWNLAFAGAAPHEDADLSGILDGAPVDFTWLCHQVFTTDVADRAQRYRAVLFASRLTSRLSQAHAREALVTVRAAMEYPALVAALERGGISDPAVISRAAFRAGQLSRIGSVERATRAITQCQGMLAMLLRGTTRLALSPSSCGELVASLSSVETSREGDYEGALVRWVNTQFGHGRAGTLDADLLALAAGSASAPATPALVEWEGTRYRVDLAHGEALRMSRLLGDEPRPYLESAVVLDAIARTWDEAAPAGGVAHQVAELAHVARVVGFEEADAWPGDTAARYRAAAQTIERMPASSDRKRRGALARALRVLADDLLARGLMELSYAAALGQPERAWITAGDVARRHSFDLRPAAGHGSAWRPPMTGNTGRPGISVTGSLLGLDIALSELALVRLSLKPPPRPPTLTDVNRRAAVEAMVLVGTASLQDGDRDGIAAAMRTGRQRLDAVHTPQDAATLAEELRLSPARVSLLRWMVTREPARLARFLSPGEILWLGRGEIDDQSTLHAWGAPAPPRLGCECLRLPRREPWETVAGRWGTGMVMSTFPDLNLRLAELLSDMRLPAPLLGPLLASATLDFVTSTASRDEDDRRALVEYVDGLDQERLEEYLGLLTTDGPLVALDAAAGTSLTGQRR
jgi:hypothetical protein